MINRKSVYNLLCLSLVAGTILVMYPMDVEILEQFSKFGVQYILFLLMFAMIFLIVDLRRIMFTSLACAAVLCIFLKKHSNYNLILPKINQEPSISVAHFNLSNVSFDAGHLVQVIDEIDADIVSFQEFTPLWNEVFADIIGDSYVASVLLERIDPYGVALYSKIPFIQVDTMHRNRFPALKARLDLGGHKVELLTSYITPPLDNNSNRQAEMQLATMSTNILTDKISAIVFGEFNDVYWSNKIRKFLSENHLRNSRRNTTPSTLEVPYDHIFFSNDMECTSFSDIKDKEGNKVGIIGRYQFKIEAEENTSEVFYGAN